MTRLKEQRWLLSAGFFHLADFPQKQQECFSEDHDRFISVGSVSREKSIYTIPTFSSCGVHIRSGDNIFSVQVATTTVYMQCPTRVFVNHWKDAFI